MRLTDSKLFDSLRRRWPWWAAFLLLMSGMLFWSLANATDLRVGSWLIDLWRDYRPAMLALAREYPFVTGLAVLILHTLLAALALPGASLLMLVAGAGYGPWVGTLICLTGCTAGASATMLATRHFLRPLARRRLGNRLVDIDRRIAADGAAYLFSLRLLPVLPFALTNIAAGLSTMKTWTFIWISFAGMLAGTFVYVNAGTQIAHVETVGDLYSPRILLSLAALAFLPWLIKIMCSIWQGRVEVRA
jgi:uncharacterized membrane protein YdjX (TVP38/TMEM64 family)